jgi:hypothetical protein
LRRGTRARTKAIVAPSGDQDGWMSSKGPEVRGVSPPPVDLRVKILRTPSESAA